MKRKILLSKGFKEPEYTLKPIKSSKFAVLNKAESLRSLTMEEANAMNLKKWFSTKITIIVKITQLSLLNGV